MAELEGEIAALQLQVQTLEQALAAANVQVASLQASWFASCLITVQP